MNFKKDNIKEYIKKVGIVACIGIMFPTSFVNAGTVNANSSNSSSGNLVINSNTNYNTNNNINISGYYNNNNSTKNNTNTDTKKNENKVNQEEKKEETTIVEEKKEVKKLSIKDVLNVDINKELNSFKSVIRVKKQDAVYLSENNTMKKDDILIYIIEYYNGTNKNIDVSFVLDLPKNIEILNDDISEENITKNDENTIISLNISSIESKKIKSFEIKVKVLSDSEFDLKNIHSKTIYSKLSVKYNEKTDDTYIMQTYINEKVSKEEKIIPAILITDIVNIQRKDDEITRQELAKMIYDLELVENSDFEEVYSDSSYISDIAKRAVYSLKKAGIMDGYTDNTFKPNNPVIKDEFMEIVTLLMNKLSNGKIKVTEPVYLYNNALKQKNNEITAYKNEIMTLINNNILSNKVNLKTDEYIKREEAINILNNIIYSNKKIETNKIKIIDQNDNFYFYNI